MSRADFWAMHPAEFWWLADARRPRGMSDDDVAAIWDDLRAQGVDLSGVKLPEECCGD